MKIKPLDKLHLSHSCLPAELINIKNKPNVLSLSQKAYVYQCEQIDSLFNYILFRKSYKDSIEPIAYVIDNSDNNIKPEVIDRAKYSLSLNGSVPILYIGYKDKVDIILTKYAPEKNKKGTLEYVSETIDFINQNKTEENKIKQYSAYRLIDGTFWEDCIIPDKKSTHQILIDKVIEADKNLDGQNNKTARKLLLITLLIKYLEDREVFPEKWFSKFSENAKSYIDILKTSNPEILLNMLKELEEHFNGDIFKLDNNRALNSKIINNLYKVINVKEIEGQSYLWDIYNFKHIPVEVLSHVYQHFTEEGYGAVFTCQYFT